ncbi:DUF5677 domain-containing protein [Bdellovibrio sp. HCB-162]|uniref:DUF5677 domain-containing protein n=1 Tax=Bdellovibrio sp. HCB-162 TaxID=3394234 RepID=UPI0039BD277A
MSTESLILDGLQLARGILLEVEKELDNKPNPDNLYVTYVGALFLRTKDLYSGSIELINFKNTAASKVLLRTLTETYVSLYGCITDRSFADQIMNTYWKQKKKQIDKFKDKQTELGFPFTNEQIEEIKSDIEKTMFPDTSSLRNAEENFRRFNMAPMYHQYYSYLSSYTHTDPYSLDEHVDKIENAYVLIPHKSLNIEALRCLQISMSLFTTAFHNYATFKKYDIRVASVLHEKSESWAKQRLGQHKMK